MPMSVVVSFADIIVVVGGTTIGSAIILARWAIDEAVRRIDILHILPRDGVVGRRLRLLLPLLLLLPLFGLPSWPIIRVILHALQEGGNAPSPFDAAVGIPRHPPPPPRRPRRRDGGY